MKRFTIGAVAVAAAFASFSTPAHATHDKVCTLPGTPPEPVCVWGHEHAVEDARDAARELVGDTQDAAWNAFLGAIMPVVYQLEAARVHFNTIPEPFCVGSICASGLRNAGLYAYGTAGWFTITPLFIAMCEATQRPCAPVPLPPL